jgi:hypothetical protein
MGAGPRLRYTARRIAQLGLIEVYHLAVHPAALAGELPLFNVPLKPKLLGTRFFPAGAIVLTDAPA